MPIRRAKAVCRERRNVEGQHASLPPSPPHTATQGATTAIINTAVMLFTIVHSLKTCRSALEESASSEVTAGSSSSLETLSIGDR